VAPCQVYLVPGFLGFASLGEFSYFRAIGEILESALRRRGIDAAIVSCATQPTGSIPRRADRLRRHVVASGGLDAEEIHFVGHSTGGLDARLLITPGVRLAPDRSEDEIVARTGSVVTVSTPHYGTPLATFFTTIQGRRLLVLLASLATSRGGRGAIFLASRAASILASVDDFVGRRDTALDEIADGLLRYVGGDEDDPLWSYLRGIYEDQGAILQLTPESMNLFNAAVTDHPGIRYACVVTAAPTPPAGYGFAEVSSPQRGAMAFLFSLLYLLTSRPHEHYPYPDPTPAQRRQLSRALPFAIDTASNDGIVPTLSQLHGRLISIALGDHLDVVGQYTRPDESLSDWLPSGAHFDEARLLAVWDAVADEIERSKRRPRRAAVKRSRPRARASGPKSKRKRTVGER
jgi:hypothetical protein